MAPGMDEKGLVELRLKKDVTKGKEKKTIAESIKKAEESVEAMKVARKNMLKYIALLLKVCRYNDKLHPGKVRRRKHGIQRINQKF